MKRSIIRKAICLLTASALAISCSVTAFAGENSESSDEITATAPLVNTDDALDLETEREIDSVLSNPLDEGPSNSEQNPADLPLDNGNNGHLAGTEQTGLKAGEKETAPELTTIYFYIMDETGRLSYYNGSMVKTEERDLTDSKGSLLQAFPAIKDKERNQVAAVEWHTKDGLLVSCVGENQNYVDRTIFDTPAGAIPLTEYQEFYAYIVGEYGKDTGGRPNDEDSGDKNTDHNGSDNNNAGDNGSNDSNSNDNGSNGNNAGDNDFNDNNAGNNGSNDSNSNDNGSNDNNAGDNSSNDNNAGDNGSNDNNAGDNGSNDNNAGNNGSNDNNVDGNNSNDDGDTSLEDSENTPSADTTASGSPQTDTSAAASKPKAETIGEDEVPLAANVPAAPAVEEIDDEETPLISAPVPGQKAPAASFNIQTGGAEIIDDEAVPLAVVPQTGCCNGRAVPAAAVLAAASALAVFAIRRKSK